MGYGGQYMARMGAKSAPTAVKTTGLTERSKTFAPMIFSSAVIDWLTPDTDWPSRTAAWWIEPVSSTAKKSLRARRVKSPLGTDGVLLVMISPLGAFELSTHFRTVCDGIFVFASWSKFGANVLTLMR